MHIILRDRNIDLVEAWKEQAENHKKYMNLDFTIEVQHGNIIDDRGASAVVSPANSFGFMDGGVDQAYTDYFGKQLQERVQKFIRENWDGEILVGQAHTIYTQNDLFPFLIVAPTMRVPKIITDPNDVYLATRAATRNAIKNGHNVIVFPGMGTGVGNVFPRKAAEMMFRGIRHAFKPLPFPNSLSEAMGDHNATLGSAVREMALYST